MSSVEEVADSCRRAVEIAHTGIPESVVALRIAHSTIDAVSEESAALGDVAGLLDQAETHATRTEDAIMNGYGHLVAYLANIGANVEETEQTNTITPEQETRDKTPTGQNIGTEQAVLDDKNLPDSEYVIRAAQACSELHAEFAGMVERRPSAWAELIQPLHNSWPHYIKVHRDDNGGYMVDVSWAFDPPPKETEDILRANQSQRIYINSRVKATAEEGEAIQRAVEQIISPKQFSRWRPPAPILDVPAVWNKEARHYHYPQAALLSRLSERLTPLLQYVRMDYVKTSPTCGWKAEKEEPSHEDQAAADWLESVSMPNEKSAQDLLRLRIYARNRHNNGSVKGLIRYITDERLHPHINAVTTIEDMTRELCERELSPVLAERSFTVEPPKTASRS